MKLEVHEHWYPKGPCGRRLIHSHEGGSVPHQHPDTGPGSYTIDKDEWERATGLKGGGKKKFTAKPSGEQAPIVELEDWQKSFVVVVGSPVSSSGEGPGIALPLRMALQFGMEFEVKG